MTTQHNTTQHNKLSLVFLVLLFSFMIQKSFATGESCNNPYTVVPDENFSNQNFLINNFDKTVWFSFIANYTDVEIYTCETATINPFTHATQIDLYNGNCNSLNLIQTKVFDVVPQGQRSLTAQGLVIGQTYYIKITAKSAASNISASFIKLSGSTALLCAPTGSILLGNGNPTTLQITTSGLLMNGVGGGFNWTFTNQNYAVAPNTTILIDANTHFINCNFYFYNLSCKIVVNNVHPQLSFDRCYLGGCNKMWTGIQDYNSDVLTVTNSIIEDAVIAIDIQNRTSYQLTVESTVFNKNLTGIYVNNSNVNFAIKNNVFTSQELYNNNVPALPAVSALKANNISSSQFPLGQSISLNFPNNNIKRSKFGIHLVNSNKLANFANKVIGDPASGPGMFNLFNYLDYGIDATTSQLTIQNNAFSSGDGTFNPNFTQPYASTGVGIIANGNVTNSNQYRIYVGGLSTSSINYQPNYFWVNPNPSILYNYSFISVLNNYYTCNPTLVSPSRNGIVNCNSNQSIFSNTGSIQFLINLTNTFNSTISVSSNHLNSSGGLISLQTSNPGANNSITIKNNHLLTDGQILLSSILSSTVDVFGNTIELKRLNPPTTTGFNYGIRLQGCENVKVYENSITGNISSTYTFDLKHYGLRGIALQKSTDCNVNCNYVSRVDEGLFFDGNCLNTVGAKEVVYTNELYNAYHGLVLNNSGQIGQQGSSTSPSDNHWVQTLAWPGYAQAYTDNSPGGLSPLYIRNTNNAGYVPTPNTSLISLQEFSLLPASGTRQFCAPCAGAGCSPSTAALIAQLEDMIKSEEAYPELSVETEWLNKKYALEKLLYEANTATLSDSILNDFADSAKYGNLGDILNLEQKLKAQDYVNAKIISDNLSPENQLEVNYKIFNGLYAEWQQNPTIEFSEVQLADLNYVAYQCYNTGGPAVLQARGFLDFLSGTVNNYPDDCPATSSERRAGESSLQKKNKSNLLVESLAVFPNPSNGIVNILIQGECKASFKLYNTLGVKVYENSSVENNAKLDLSNIDKGSYFYSISFPNGKVTKGKFLILN